MTPTSLFSKEESDSISMQGLVPGSFLTVPGRLNYGNRGRDGRVIVGMEFHIPGGQYRGFCSPGEDVEVYHSEKSIDMDLSDITYEQLLQNQSQQSLLSKCKDTLRDFDMKGFLVFDMMRPEPPIGTGHLLREEAEVFFCFLKNPRDEWPKLFPLLNRTPFSSLTMRTMIAQHAIANPDLYVFRKAELYGY